MQAPEHTFFGLLLLFFLSFINKDCISCGMIFNVDEVSGSANICLGNFFPQKLCGVDERGFISLFLLY